MSALVGLLPPTLVAVIVTVFAVRTLLSPLIRVTVALVAIMAATDRAERAERVLSVLVRDVDGPM